MWLVFGFLLHVAYFTEGHVSERPSLLSFMSFMFDVRPLVWFSAFFREVVISSPVVRAVALV